MKCLRSKKKLNGPVFTTCVCVWERERQYMRKTMALRRKNASFSTSSATKRGLTDITSPDHHLPRQRGRTKSLFEAHGSRHPTRRRRCLWQWWRDGKMVGIEVGGIYIYVCVFIQCDLILLLIYKWF